MHKNRAFKDLGNVIEAGVRTVAGVKVRFLSKDMTRADFKHPSARQVDQVCYKMGENTRTIDNKLNRHEVRCGG